MYTHTALDLSWATCGYVGWNGLSEKREIGTIKFQPKETLFERVNAIRVIVPIDLTMPVFVEGYAYGASGKNAMLIPELRGALKYNLELVGIKVIEVPPTKIKKFATGSGIAPKSTMMLEVFKRWGINPKSDHEADAFALWKLAEAYLTFKENGPVGLSHLPKFQQESIRSYVKEYDQLT